MADVVIVDVHWGKEHTYSVTSQMADIAKLAIDSGADMVVGTHALGVYSIQKYKDKPIIYSLGSLINDSDYDSSKEGFIFNINISEDAKIKSIEMIPTYILDFKETVLYSEYNSKKCASYLEMYNKWQIENGLDSKIELDKIVVYL